MEDKTQPASQHLWVRAVTPCPCTRIGGRRGSHCQPGCSHGFGMCLGLFVATRSFCWLVGAGVSEHSTQNTCEDTKFL